MELYRSKFREFSLVGKQNFATKIKGSLFAVRHREILMTDLGLIHLPAKLQIYKHKKALCQVGEKLVRAGPNIKPFI